MFQQILAALQNGVAAINNLAQQLESGFPSITLVSTHTRGSTGSITFTSSQATQFVAAQTSSGYIVGWVPLYPSS
jgi:hypothetical protein